MGRTYRKRKKKQLPQEHSDFCKVINLQKSLRLKCPNLRIDYFDGIGWGVRSMKRIEEGEVIIRLPLNHLITPGVQCEIFSFITIENQPPQFVLSVFLVYEVHLKENSTYFEYIESLPKSFTNLYFCTEDEVKLLPEFLKSELISQRSHIRKNFNQLSQLIIRKSCPHCGENLENIYTSENFIWAWFIVNTRSVYYEDEEHKKSLALAPFLDLFNHSNNAITKMSIDFERGLYTLQTQVNFKKFDQVFIKYGDHSNLKLLLEYGFILSDNTNDFVEFSFQEVLNTVKELDVRWGEMTKKKYNFIKSNKLNQHLTKNTEFSWNFRALILVLLSSDQNLFLTLQTKVYSNASTLNEKDIIKKISETVTVRKYNELKQNLRNMENVDKCTESFNLAKKLIKMHMNFLK